jgi:hypothetical protein
MQDFTFCQIGPLFQDINQLELIRVEGDLNWQRSQEIIHHDTVINVAPR